MKTKEIKTLAKKIAQQELIIRESDDSAIIKRAENEIMKLSSHVKSLNDMVAVDDMVREILKNS